MPLVRWQFRGRGPGQVQQISLLSPHTLFLCSLALVQPDATRGRISACLKINDPTAELACRHSPPLLQSCRPEVRRAAGGFGQVGQANVRYEGHRVIAVFGNVPKLLYGGGLRVLECAQLPVRRRLQTRVRPGRSKGSRCKAAREARREAYCGCTSQRRASAPTPQMGPFQPPGGHSDDRTTTIYTHVLNRGWGAVPSPADRMLLPEAPPPAGGRAPAPPAGYTAGPRKLIPPAETRPGPMRPVPDAELGPVLPPSA